MPFNMGKYSKGGSSELPELDDMEDDDMEDTGVSTEVEDAALVAFPELADSPERLSALLELIRMVAGE